MYFSIHYLRGVAALMVVATHAFPSFAIGRAGVDLFFIISGFVMVVCAERPGVTARGFLLDRATRIFPLWWVALAVFVPLTLLVDSSEAQMWTTFLTPEPGQIAASLLLLPHYSDLNTYYVAYSVGWTLQFEMVFYLTFTAAIALGSWWLALAALLAAVASHVAGFDLRFNNPIILEFAGGALLATVRQRLPLWAAGALLVGVALFLLNWNARDILAPLRVVMLGVPAMLCVTGAVALERHMPTLRLPQFFGDASYSIYLFHMIGYLVAGRAFGFHSSWFGPAAFACGVGLGIAAHVWIERPIMLRLRDLQPRTLSRARSR